MVEEMDVPPSRRLQVWTSGAEGDGREKPMEKWTWD